MRAAFAALGSFIANGGRLRRPRQPIGCRLRCARRPNVPMLRNGLTEAHTHTLDGDFSRC
ncbi:hypothetical protein PR003_g26370 [Phytophthora rubi]|uniref:Uncharacterized protein n=1 Tax=Phytophthora rubi TaxID=129364 RepID=A0A6A3IFI0_9STRA|nr:hypothetical protein PR002_g25069 [Phytophthora rubi]KAE8979255.1 hypothetical protein PR001_g24608 [Phytophthora rubi]KAE9286236.1 hypothetical protein PR003_g26370 [Phytophthora rubi]